MIYFDNAASCKINQKALDAFNKYSLNYFANPSSPHIYAKECERFYDVAKEQILKSLHLNGYNLIFTSGATEANNLAIIGYARRNKSLGNHIITSKIEHASILNVFKYLEGEGFDVTYLDVDEEGKVNIKQLKNSINDKTILVSIISVNNEIGSINDLKEIKEIIKDNKNIKLHTDASQAIGKSDIDLSYADMITISGHKVGAPKGIGALLVKDKILLSPLFYGGGQQDDLRSGTMDLPEAISFAVALKETMAAKKANFAQISSIRDEICRFLKENEDEFLINSPKDATPYILNFSLKNKKASVVVEALAREGIMVSSVSACSSKKEPESYVVRAINRDEKLAKNTIRISFSSDNTLIEAKTFEEKLLKIVKELKA